MKLSGIAVLLFLFSFNGWGQELKISSEQTVELDKAVVKSGRYAGTSVSNNEIEVLYFLGSSGNNLDLFQYTLPNDLSAGKAKGKSFSDAGNSQYEWYLPEDQMQKSASGNERFFVAKSNLMGALVVQFGNIEKEFVGGIFVDWKFKKDNRMKAKGDDIMKIMPAGFKSLTDYSEMKLAHGFSLDLPKYGNELMAPVGATILSAGVIADKVSVKNPPATNFNRVAAITISGESMNDAKINEYLLPYAAIAITSGKTPENQLGALFAPMKIISTVQSHKNLNWSDRKNHFTFMRFADDRSLSDSISFPSHLMMGTFNIFDSNGASLIVGIGDAKHDGWFQKVYSNNELKRINGFQFTKVKDGKLIYNKMYSDDDLQNKLKTPSGSKVKFNFDKQFMINEVVALPGGGDLVLGATMASYYVFQLSGAGDLVAYYQLPRIDDKDNKVYNYQYQLNETDFYLAWNEQPLKLTNETQVEFNYNDYGVYASQTKTVKRLNEVYLETQLVKINTRAGSISNAIEIGKEYYACGSDPVLFTPFGIYITGKKGIKGKEIIVARIAY